MSKRMEVHFPTDCSAACLSPRVRARDVIGLFSLPALRASDANLLFLRHARIDTRTLILSGKKNAVFWTPSATRSLSLLRQIRAQGVPEHCAARREGQIQARRISHE